MPIDELVLEYYPNVIIVSHKVYSSQNWIEVPSEVSRNIMSTNICGSLDPIIWLTPNTGGLLSTIIHNNLASFILFNC